MFDKEAMNKALLSEEKFRLAKLRELNWETWMEGLLTDDQFDHNMATLNLKEIELAKEVGWVNVGD